MLVKRVVVEIERCIVDGLPHEIVLDLETVLLQGMLEDLLPVSVERDVVLTCPTTGRTFLATIPLPQPPGEVIASVTQGAVAPPSS